MIGRFGREILPHVLSFDIECGEFDGGGCSEDPVRRDNLLTLIHEALQVVGETRHRSRLVQPVVWGVVLGAAEPAGLLPVIAPDWQGSSEVLAGAFVFATTSGQLVVFKTKRSDQNARHGVIDPATAALIDATSVLESLPCDDLAEVNAALRSDDGGVWRYGRKPAGL